MADTKQTVTAYKGFDANMRCRDYQFEIGKTYTHDGDVQACQSGFHACEYPLDVFGYYAPANSQFAIVEQSGELGRHADDTKVASSRITIKTSLNIPGLVKVAIEYTTLRADPKKASSATGYRSASLTTGSYSSSQILRSDKPQRAVAIATGYDSKARAPEGSAIVLVHRNDRGEIVHIRAAKVGENGIKPDVWYRLDGDCEFVEA